MPPHLCRGARNAHRVFQERMEHLPVASRIARYGDLGRKVVPVIGPNALNGRYSVTHHRTVQSNLHVREFQEGDLLFNTLCMEKDGSPIQLQANFLIPNLTNQAIKYPRSSGDACALTPWGLVDRTFTNALSDGGTLQAAATTR
jgi:hypothetical protein